MTLFAPTVLPDNENARRAFLDMIDNLNKEGVASGMLVTPLYDTFEDLVVAVIGIEVTDAGPAQLSAVGAWSNALLTVDLNLDPAVSYRISGSASCDAHLASGTAWSTAEVRVRSGAVTKTVLHQQRGSSTSVEQYTQINVPFTEELSTGEESYTVDFDAQMIASVSTDPIDLEYLRLIVIAIPVYPSVLDVE